MCWFCLYIIKWLISPCCFFLHETYKSSISIIQFIIYHSVKYSNKMTLNSFSKVYHNTIHIYPDLSDTETCSHYYPVMNLNYYMVLWSPQFQSLFLLITTGCTNEKRPLDKLLYFSNSSVDLSQTFRHILQTWFYKLMWFNRYNSLNFKVHFFK